MLSIGMKIKQRREEIGLSRDELTELMGYKSRTSIARIERGESDVTFTNLIKFSKILNVDISYFTRTCDNTDASSPLDTLYRVSISYDYKQMNDVLIFCSLEKAKRYMKEKWTEMTTSDAYDADFEGKEYRNRKNLMHIGVRLEETEAIVCWEKNNGLYIVQFKIEPCINMIFY